MHLLSCAPVLLLSKQMHWKAHNSELGEHLIIGPVSTKLKAIREYGLKAIVPALVENFSLLFQMLVTSTKCQ